MDCPVHSLNKRNKVSNWGRHFQIIFSWTFLLELWKYSQWFLHPLPSNHHLHHLGTDAFNATASLNFICLVGCIESTVSVWLSWLKGVFCVLLQENCFPTWLKWSKTISCHYDLRGISEEVGQWGKVWKRLFPGSQVPRFPGSPVFDLRQKPANSGVLFALGYPRCTFLLNTYFRSINARCTILSLATLW